MHCTDSKIICVLYPNVYKLVANLKKIVVKLIAIIELCKEKDPATPLPRIRAIICWGVWLDSVVYYSKNFETRLTKLENSTNLLSETVE